MINNSPQRVFGKTYQELLEIGFPNHYEMPTAIDIMLVFNDGVQNMTLGMDWKDGTTDNFLWWYAQTDMVTCWNEKNSAEAAAKAFIEHRKMLSDISKSVRQGEPKGYYDSKADKWYEQYEVKQMGNDPDFDKKLWDKLTTNII